MAAIGALYPTYADIVKRTDPNGAISKTVDFLAKVNPILQDMAVKEGNLPTGHLYTGDTSLPSVYFRRFNKGVPYSKGTTEQYTETCGMLAGYSRVDCKLANLNGNAAAFRASEDKKFISALNNQVATSLIYGNIDTTPESFNGLSIRLNQTANNPAAAQIIKADTSASGADQTSIYLMGLSPDTVFMTYPKGSQGGMRKDDLGKQLVVDASSNPYTAWVTEWNWDLGLVVQDSRYVVRGANIDTSNWKADLSAGADLVQVMLDMYAALWETNTVQPVYYMNRQCFSMFNKQLAKKGTANLLEWIDRGGQRVAAFLGIPIRIIDAITNTESVVV